MKKPIKHLILLLHSILPHIQHLGFMLVIWAPQGLERHFSQLLPSAASSLHAAFLSRYAEDPTSPRCLGFPWLLGFIFTVSHSDLLFSKPSPGTHYLPQRVFEIMEQQQPCPLSPCLACSFKLVSSLFFHKWNTKKQSFCGIYCSF